MLNLISLYFIAFFAVFAFVYYLVPKKLQWVFLLTGSLFFYLSSDIRFLFYILTTTVTTFFAAKLIYSTNSKMKNESETIRKKLKRQRWLIICAALFINIGILLFLKYFNFFAYSFSVFSKSHGLGIHIKTLDMIMPLGISFYTLQAIGYVIDVYRGKYKPQDNFVKYMLFISFFPQVIQGPIARYDALGEQLYKKHYFDYTQVKFGLQLMLWGYFKKMVIADRAAILVNHVFDNYKDFSGIAIVTATLLYAVQLYADFSGCVDIVTGAAQVFGIKLAPNFDKPYFATSIQDFWHRWHISLSTWLRDYLYFPLGGSRKGIFRKYANILIVFIVSGIWHGTGLHYIFWGLLHGGYQVAGSLLMPIRKKTIKLFKIDTSSFSHKFFQAIFTFLLVDFAWLFFRAKSLTVAFEMLSSIAVPFMEGTYFLDILRYSLGIEAADFNLLIIAIGVLLIVSILQTKFHIREKLAKQALWFRWLIYFIAITAILVFGIYGPGFDSNQFIYLRF